MINNETIALAQSALQILLHASKAGTGNVENQGIPDASNGGFRNQTRQGSGGVNQLGQISSNFQSGSQIHQHNSNLTTSSSSRNLNQFADLASSLGAALSDDRGASTTKLSQAISALKEYLNVQGERDPSNRGQKRARADAELDVMQGPVSVRPALMDGPSTMAGGIQNSGFLGGTMGSLPGMMQAGSGLQGQGIQSGSGGMQQGYGLTGGMLGSSMQGPMMQGGMLGSSMQGPMMQGGMPGSSMQGPMMQGGMLGSGMQGSVLQGGMVGSSMQDYGMQGAMTGFANQGSGMQGSMPGFAMQGGMPGPGMHVFGMQGSMPGPGMHSLGIQAPMTGPGTYGSVQHWQGGAVEGSMAGPGREGPVGDDSDSDPAEVVHALNLPPDSDVPVQTGVLDKLPSGRLFGFILPDGRQQAVFFVHYKERWLRLGRRVAFQEVPNPAKPGHTWAVNIRKLLGDGAVAPEVKRIKMDPTPDVRARPVHLGTVYAVKDGFGFLRPDGSDQEMYFPFGATQFVKDMRVAFNVKTNPRKPGKFSAVDVVPVEGPAAEPAIPPELIGVSPAPEEVAAALMVQGKTAGEGNRKRGLITFLPKGSKLGVLVPEDDGPSLVFVRLLKGLRPFMRVEYTEQMNELRGMAWAVDLGTLNREDGRREAHSLGKAPNLYPKDASPAPAADPEAAPVESNSEPAPATEDTAEATVADGAEAPATAHQSGGGKDTDVRPIPVLDSLPVPAAHSRQRLSRQNSLNPHFSSHSNANRKPAVAVPAPAPSRPVQGASRLDRPGLGFSSSETHEASSVAGVSDRPGGQGRNRGGDLGRGAVGSGPAGPSKSIQFVPGGVCPATGASKGLVKDAEPGLPKNKEFAAFSTGPKRCHLDQVRSLKAGLKEPRSLPASAAADRPGHTRKSGVVKLMKPDLGIGYIKFVDQRKNQEAVFQLPETVWLQKYSKVTFELAPSTGSKILSAINVEPVHMPTKGGRVSSFITGIDLEAPNPYEGMRLTGLIRSYNRFSFRGIVSFINPESMLEVAPFELEPAKPNTPVRMYNLLRVTFELIPTPKGKTDFCAMNVEPDGDPLDPEKKFSFAISDLEDDWHGGLITTQATASEPYGIINNLVDRTKVKYRYADYPEIQLDSIVKYRLMFDERVGELAFDLSVPLAEEVEVIALNDLEIPKAITLTPSREALEARIARKLPAPPLYSLEVREKLAYKDPTGAKNCQVLSPAFREIQHKIFDPRTFEKGINKLREAVESLPRPNRYYIFQIFTIVQVAAFKTGLVKLTSHIQEFTDPTGLPFKIDLSSLGNRHLLRVLADFLVYLAHDRPDITFTNKNFYRLNRVYAVAYTRCIKNPEDLEANVPHGQNEPTDGSDQEAEGDDDGQPEERLQVTITNDNEDDEDQRQVSTGEGTDRLQVTVTNDDEHQREVSSGGDTERLRVTITNDHTGDF